MPCASSCKTQDHGTFGNCIRQNGLHIDTYGIRHGEAEKANTRELNLYEQARRDGLHPPTTRTADIVATMRDAE